MGLSLARYGTFVGPCCVVEHVGVQRQPCADGWSEVTGHGHVRGVKDFGRIRALPWTDSSRCFLDMCRDSPWPPAFLVPPSRAAASDGGFTSQLFRPDSVMSLWRHFVRSNC